MDERYEEYVIVYNNNDIVRDPFCRIYIYQTKEEALCMFPFLLGSIQKTARVCKLSETIKITEKIMV